MKPKFSSYLLNGKGMYTGKTGQCFKGTPLSESPHNSEDHDHVAQLMGAECDEH
jgi:hypothetical protein